MKLIRREDGNKTIKGKLRSEQKQKNREKFSRNIIAGQGRENFARRSTSEEKQNPN